MSRATAVAYDVPDMLPARTGSSDGWPGRGDSSMYMLLDDSDAFGGPVPLRLDEETVLPLSQEEGYLSAQVEMPSGYFDALQDEPLTGRARALSPRLIVAAAVALILAIALALVSPVLARGQFGGGTSEFVLSQYSDAESGPSASIAAPVVDATAGAPAPGTVRAPAPAPPADAGSYSVVAAPSLSVGQIEKVLGQYGSPAEGQGQALYDLGVKYGIDPAYALAFFVHESACGTRGVARFTHSLGNIRWTDGYDNYEGYRSYATWQAGMEDWYKLVTDLYINGWGLRTVDQIIPVYAPAADSNSPPTYIASVKSMVDSWRGK